MTERFDLGAALPALTRAFEAIGAPLVVHGDDGFSVQFDEEPPVSISRDGTGGHVEALVEAIPEPVFIVGLNGISYGNPAAVRLFGYARIEEALGQDPRSITHPDDVPELEQRAVAMLVHRRTLPPFEYRVFRRDGSLITIEVSSIPVDYQGAPSILTFARDVTERKRTEAALLQADRLAVLGFLAGGLAHAMNNPLSYVLLNLDEVERSLVRGLPTDPERERVLQRLREAYQGAQRIAEVVRRMRALSRVDDDKRSPVDVRGVLESALDLMGNELRHRGEFTVELGEAPPVLASRSRLEQVFLNLLAHASQSLPESGEGRILLTMTGDAARVVVEVLEHTDAVDPGEISRMLEPFPTPREGMRRMLSLPLCRSIVEGLGGEMSVADQAGGLRVRLVLPTAGARTSPGAPLSTSRVVGPSKPAPVRILVVDSDVTVGPALRLILQPEHSITCIRDAKEAVEALLAGEHYDAVLCDANSCSEAGSFLDEIETQRPELLSRIALMVGGEPTDDQRRLLARVLRRVIGRPFDRDKVRALVNELRSEPEAH